MRMNIVILFLILFLFFMPLYFHMHFFIINKFYYYLFYVCTYQVAHWLCYVFNLLQFALFIFFYFCFVCCSDRKTINYISHSLFALLLFFLRSPLFNLCGNHRKNMISELITRLLNNDKKGTFIGFEHSFFCCCYFCYLLNDDTNY